MVLSVALVLLLSFFLAFNLYYPCFWVLDPVTVTPLAFWRVRTPRGVMGNLEEPEGILKSRLASDLLGAAHLKLAFVEVEV